MNAKAMEIYYIYIHDLLYFVLHDGDRIENLHYFDFIPKNFNERGKKQDGIEVTGTPVWFVDFSLTKPAPLFQKKMMI